MRARLSERVKVRGRREAAGQTATEGGGVAGGAVVGNVGGERIRWGGGGGKIVDIDSHGGWWEGVRRRRRGKGRTCEAFTSDPIFATRTLPGRGRRRREGGGGGQEGTPFHRKPHEPVGVDREGRGRGGDAMGTSKNADEKKRVTNAM